MTQGDIDNRDIDNIVWRTLSALLKALVHPLNLVIPIFGLLLGFSAPFGVITLNVSVLASTIFAVAGTMVALILPASQFANSIITKLADELPKHMLAAKIPPEKKIEVTRVLTTKLRANLYPAWRACALVFISFLFSGAAMLSPPSKLPLGCVAFTVDALLAALALGSLVVGSAWFLPTAEWAFSLQVLDDLTEVIELIAPDETKP